MPARMPERIDTSRARGRCPERLALLCGMLAAGGCRQESVTGAGWKIPPGFPPACVGTGTALEGPFPFAGFKDWSIPGAPHFPPFYFGGIAAVGPGAVGAGPCAGASGCMDGGRGRVIWNANLDDDAGTHTWGLMAAEIENGRLGVVLLEDAGEPGGQVASSALPEALPPFAVAGAFVQGTDEDYVWGRSVPQYPEPPKAEPLIQLTVPGQESSDAPLPVVPPDPGAGPPYLLPWCTEVGDFNGDGQLDLLECVHGSGGVNRTLLVLGDGTGHFAAGPTWDVPYDATPPAGRWLDRPGRELLIPEDGGSSIVFALADGGVAEVPTNLPDFRIWAADLNGDGLDDALGGNGLQLFWNRGGGRFERAAALVQGLAGQSYVLAAGNFGAGASPGLAVLQVGPPLANCVLPDGYPPRTVCTGGSWYEAIGTLSLLESDGDGGYCTSLTVDAGAVASQAYLNDLIPAQLTGQGHDDLATTTWSGITLFLSSSP